MNKKSAQITVHLSHEYQQAVQNLANMENLSASEWVCNLIERELRQVYHDAQYKLNAVKCIRTMRVNKSLQFQATKNPAIKTGFGAFNQTSTNSTMKTA